MQDEWPVDEGYTQPTPPAIEVPVRKRRDKDPKPKCVLFAACRYIRDLVLHRRESEDDPKKLVLYKHRIHPLNLVEKCKAYHNVRQIGSAVANPPAYVHSFCF